MSDEVKIKNSTLRLVKGDITDLEIESFVFYANHDLQLGSGFGNAIAQRGGPSIQKELEKIGALKTTEVAITLAGEMKAKYILHAVGPRFQEEDIAGKLAATIKNCLKQADEKGIKAIAFPPMGAGFFGVPLPTSAEITLKTIVDYLSNGSSIEDVAVTLLDTREYSPFKEKLAALKQVKEKK